MLLDIYNILAKKTRNLQTYYRVFDIPLSNIELKVIIDRYLIRVLLYLNKYVGTFLVNGR